MLHRGKWCDAAGAAAGEGRSRGYRFGSGGTGAFAEVGGRCDLKPLQTLSRPGRPALNSLEEESRPPGCS